MVPVPISIVMMQSMIQNLFGCWYVFLSELAWSVSGEFFESSSKMLGRIKADIQCYVCDMNIGAFQ